MIWGWVEPFYKHWLGLQPLSRAFWLFGCLGFIVVNVSAMLLVRHPLQDAGLVGLGYGLTALIVWSYCIFAWVGIWRSAHAYLGPSRWASLAQVAVCLFAGVMATGFFRNGGFPRLLALLMSSN